MKNIFENAKFGDKFLTRDNRMVLFDKNVLRKEIITYCYHQDLGPISYNYQNGKCLNFTEGDCDIVSRYKEPIDEEKLDELANEFADKVSIPFSRRSDIDSFKAGYRKAIEG